MRWDDLFADLEGRLRAEEQRELDAEVADRTRRERALLGLHERLLAATSGSVDLCVAGVGQLRGRVVDVGADWLLLAPDRVTSSPSTAAPTGSSGPSGSAAPSGTPVHEDPVAGSRVLVPFAALRSATLPPGRMSSLGAVARTFGIGAALRAISRDRSVVDLFDLDGGLLTGTIDAVGRDVLDLAEHPVDLPRRSEHVRAVRTVPFTALALVRRRA